MTPLLIAWMLAAPTPCPPGQMRLGVDAAGAVQCGSWLTLQLQSRRGGGPVVKLPPGAVKRPAPNTFLLPRAAVAELLAKGLGRLASQARVEPKYVKGKRIGFGISRIRGGSLLETLGLRNGDLLIDVNGVDLGKPASVLGLYALLFRPNAEATLNLRRAGKPLRLVWRIEG